jgi:hypothetical protein
VAPTSRVKWMRIIQVSWVIIVINNERKTKRETKRDFLSAMLCAVLKSSL